MFVRNSFTIIANMGLHLNSLKLDKYRVRAQKNTS